MPRIFAMIAALAIVAGAATLGPQAVAIQNDDVTNPEPQGNPDYDNAVRAVKAENFRRAIEHLAEVLADEPRNADALNYMGYSYRKLGDVNRAISYYNKALAVDPNHTGAIEYLGETYLEINDLPMAEKHLERLRAICGVNCEAYHELNAAVAAYKAKRKPDQSSRRRW